MNGRTTPLPSKSTRAISFRDHTPKSNWTRSMGSQCATARGVIGRPAPLSLNASEPVGAPLLAADAVMEKEETLGIVFLLDCAPDAHAGQDGRRDRRAPRSATLGRPRSFARDCSAVGGSPRRRKARRAACRARPPRRSQSDRRHASPCRPQRPLPPARSIGTN